MTGPGTASLQNSFPRTGRLAGRRIVVVGAGTRPSEDPDSPVGNGRAIAVLAGREGARVACVDRSHAAARATVEVIAGEGGRAVPVVADASDEAGCATIASEATALLGGAIDGLVLNVGIGAGRLLAGTSSRVWDQVLSINLRSHFLTAQACLPELSDGASIVFIGSTAALVPYSLSPAYDSSKAALLGLSRHVAYEAATRGIRANLVHPGFIDTPIGRLASAGRPERDEVKIPLGRQGTGWDVARAVAFLLSDDSSYITGQTLAVDGGFSGLHGIFNADTDAAR